MPLNELSEQLLLIVKMEEQVDGLLRQLHDVQRAELDDLSTDTQKIAFWVNSYNAWYQILRKQHRIAKRRIYNERLVEIGGDRFSLDDIEHGILRRYKFKYLAGYVPNPFAGRRIKQLSVRKLDWRIHFALNCGAESCPPIAFYTVSGLNEQLDLATSSYLQTETSIDHDSKQIQVSKLFQWFAADFGGRGGVLKLIEERLDVELEGYRLRFKPYSWTEELANFA